MAQHTGALAGKKLGILLSTSPEHPNFPRVLALTKASLEEDVRVYLYCIDEGVRCVNTPRIQELKKNSNLKLFGCAYGAHNRCIPVDEAAAYSGLTVVADVIASTDRFLFFG